MSTKEETKQEAPDAVKYFGEDEPGLVEGLEALFNDSPSDSPASEPISTPKASEPESAKVEPEPTKTPEKPNAEPANDIPEIEADGMFGQDAPEEPEDKALFDEKSFDAETDKLIKTLEEKGHPGEVYKQLRTELKELKQKIDSAPVPEDVQKELESLRQAAEEVEGLRQKLDEVSSVSAKVKVEQSDDYKKQILAPAQDILRNTQELSQSYGIDAQKLNAIIIETDRMTRNKMIEETMEEFSEMDRQDVYSMIRTYQNLQEKRATMLDEAEKTISKSQAEREKQAEAEYEEQRKSFRTIQDGIWAKYQDALPGMVDENGAATDDFIKLKRKAMAIDMKKATPKDEAYAAFSGVMIPHLVKELHKANRKISELEGVEQKKARSTPKVTPVGAVTQSSGDNDGDFLTALRDRFK